MVISRELPRVCAAKDAVELGKVVNMLFFPKLLHHFYKNLRELPGIVAGSVVVKGRELEIMSHRVELMVFKVRIHRARHCHSIGVKIVKIPAEAFVGGSEEAGIESGVVRHKEFRVSAEFIEFLKGFLLARSVGNHRVVYPGELGYALRDMALRVHKSTKFVPQDAVHNSDGADFGYSLRCGGKPRRFKVKSDYFIFKRNVRVSVNRLHGIVHIIGFDAENGFEVFVLERIYRVHNFREALHYAVVRYGYSPVTPLVSTVYEFFRRGHSVHLGHICMQMKLEALFGLVVGSIKSFNFTDISWAYSYIVLIFIERSLAVYEDSRSGFEGEHVFSVLLFRNNFKADGACEVVYHY